MQFFLAVFLVESGEEHAAGFETHHGTGRQVGDRHAGLADQLFRLVESVNTENPPVMMMASLYGRMIETTLKKPEYFSREMIQ